MNSVYDKLVELIDDDIEDIIINLNESNYGSIIMCTDITDPKYTTYDKTDKSNANTLFIFSQPDANTLGLSGTGSVYPVGMYSFLTWDSTLQVMNETFSSVINIDMTDGLIVDYTASPISLDIVIDGIESELSSYFMTKTAADAMYIKIENAHLYQPALSNITDNSLLLADSSSSDGFIGISYITDLSDPRLGDDSVLSIGVINKLFLNINDLPALSYPYLLYVDQNQHINGIEILNSYINSPPNDSIYTSKATLEMTSSILSSTIYVDNYIVDVAENETDVTYKITLTSNIISAAVIPNNLCTSSSGTPGDPSEVNEQIIEITLSDGSTAYRKVAPVISSKVTYSINENEITLNLSRPESTATIGGKFYGTLIAYLNIM